MINPTLVASTGTTRSIQESRLGFTVVAALVSIMANLHGILQVTVCSYCCVQKDNTTVTTNMKLVIVRIVTIASKRQCILA